MRVLFATTVLPDPTRSGGEVVSAAFVSALARSGAQVAVIGYARPGAGPVPLPAGASGQVVDRRPIESADASRAQRSAWMARALLTGQGFSVAKYRSRAYATALRRADPWDVAVVDHVQVAWAMRHVGRPVALLTHNAEAAHYRELAAAASGPAAAVWRREARSVARLEQRAVDAADELWTLTSDDAAQLSAAARVFRVPPAVSDTADAPAAEPHAARVALLGSWTWRPNLEGLCWFRERVVPLLDPGLEVCVAGSGAELAGPWPASVRLLGRVDDAAAFLAGAGVVAVPAVAGTGIQIKTLDAIASGAAVVATSVGLRGIDDLPASVTRADGPEAFAAAIAAAARQPPSGAGLAWARRRRAAFDAEVATAIAALAG